MTNRLPPVAAAGARFWSDARMELLKRLVAEGVSYGQIGKQLRCSRNAALGKAHRLGLAHPRKASPPSLQAKALKAPAVKRDLHVNAGLAFGTRKLAKPQVRTLATDTAPPPAGEIYRGKVHLVPPGARVLADLGTRCCRWSVGADPGPGNGERQLFCAAETDAGERYCTEHRPLGIQKSRTPDRIAADEARAAKMRAGKKPTINSGFFGMSKGRAA